MNLITLTGLRGGGGTTTVAAMVGDALHGLKQRVLLVDLNASDQLRLHFDIPLGDDHGWVASSFPPQWQQQAFELAPGLVLVPFGRKAIESSGVSHLLRGDDFWVRVLPELDRDFDWVVFDCPPCPNRLSPALRFRSALDILVAHPDVAAHVLLAQMGLDSTSYLLVNGFDPGQSLERDVVLDWQCRYGDRMLPRSIHRDKILHEALAHKQTVMRYRPGAAVSQAARDLARWCLSVCPEPS